MNNSQLWNLFLEKVKNEVSSATYDTWFSNTKIIEINDNVVSLLVPYHIHKKMLSENYNDMIENIFTEISGSNFKFKYLLEEEINNENSS